MKTEYLKLFIQIDKSRNITHAGKLLGLSPAVACSYLNKLEGEFGARLINRSTRNVIITDAGKQLLPIAKNIIDELDFAKDLISSDQKIVSGNLTIAMPRAVGYNYVMPKMKEFMNTFPNIDLSIKLENTDKINDDVDILIASTNLNDSNLIAKKILDGDVGLFSSKEYIDTYGRPETFDDLMTHQIINVTTPLGLYSKNYNIKSILKNNAYINVCSVDVAKDLVKNGFGMSVLPFWSVKELLTSNTLIEVPLQTKILSKNDVFAIYRTRKIMDCKIRAFLEFYTDLEFFCS